MNPSVQNLLKANEILAKLESSVTYVGGAVIPLYMEDPSSEPPRPTKDVDTIVKATTYSEYVKIQKELRNLGAVEATDPQDPQCRWKYQNLKIDVMPEQGDYFGFTNDWYKEGVQNAITKKITDDTRIRVFTPVYLIADKINTFRDRGEKDYFASRDFEDIVRLVDGCSDLPSKIKKANPGVCSYIQEWVKKFLQNPRAIEYIAAHITHRGRADVLAQRFKDMVD